jgi:hypothetical protein
LVSNGCPCNKKLESLNRKKHFGRWSRCENNIKIVLKQRGFEVVGCIHIAQDEGLVASSCEHGIGPSGALKGGK